MHSDEPDQEAYEQWGERKSDLMEQRLGPMHDTVMHSIIPYALGGALDLYYYVDGIPGTAIATMELSELPGTGSTNSIYTNYELVMFTKLPLDIASAKKPETPFGAIHSRFSAILNRIAPYSADAELNPNETCEFPPDMETVGGRCLIFDAYNSDPNVAEEDFGLLVLIEIFRSEMDFARSQGGAALIERLKTNGHYPYSDLDRDPVT